MNISYDAKVDALSIRLFPSDHQVETRQVDDDIYLDFDEADRLVSIEVLDASKRVDLDYLLPVSLRRASDGSQMPSRGRSANGERSPWDRLTRELRRRKKAGIPVKTISKGRKNWVEEVSEDYVVVKRDRTGNTLKITRRAFEGGAREWSITRALRELAASL